MDKEQTDVASVTLFSDYTGSSNALSESMFRTIMKKLETIEKNQTDQHRRQMEKHNEIHEFLKENRARYIQFLEQVSRKEDVLTDLIKETRKVLNENRVLYGQSFDSILQGERQLRDLLEKTQKILEENRTIYSDALKDLSEQERRNRKILEELKEFNEEDNYGWAYA